MIFSFGVKFADDWELFFEPEYPNIKMNGTVLTSLTLARARCPHHINQIQQVSHRKLRDQVSPWQLNAARQALAALYSLREYPRQHGRPRGLAMAYGEKKPGNG